MPGDGWMADASAFAPAPVRSAGSGPPPAPPARIVQIVPRRSRRPEGIGDYARLLAEEFRDVHGLETVFLSGTPLPTDEAVFDAWRTETVKTRGAQNLVAALDTLSPFDAILLHVSGYGYEKRGVPIWLASGLEIWRREHAGVPIAALFHELNAVSGRPWNSSFWLSPVQLQVCKRLARLSSTVFATTSPYAATLSQWRQGNKVDALPVFSTIGRTHVVKPTSDRKRALVTFGTEKVRDRVYIQGRARLASIVQQVGATEIWDIGNRDGPLPSQVAGATVRPHGACSEMQIRDVLAEAAFGLVDYPAQFLEKSTVCAAFVANGVIPVLMRERDSLRPARYGVLGSVIDQYGLTPGRLDEFQRANLAAYTGQSARDVIASRIVHALRMAER